MASPVYFSPRVIDTVSSLPARDRIPVSNALSMEFILGIDPTETLTPMQNIIYNMIKFYVHQDASRMRDESVHESPLSSASTSFRPGRRAFG